MSTISELDDNCFVLATDYVSSLCKEIEQEIGEKPTIKELCELLAWGFRQCSSDIFKDVNPESVIELKPILKKRGKLVLRAGDVMAIPRKRGGYYFIVFIAKGIGHAFGILKGHHKVRRIPPKWMPEVIQHPVYTGTERILSGDWRLIGHREDWLALFPSDPEIFLTRSFFPHDKTIGPFGSGVNAKGERRDLTKEEAEELGIIQNTYRQFLGDEQFEAYLARRLR